MSQITWNTDVNAPCCPGEIVGPKGKSILIQTDWDYPGTASSFGWYIGTIQKCPACGYVGPCEHVDDDFTSCSKCGHEWHGLCPHDGTDGTVDCKACGVTASDFISAAGDWLRDNDGATADDPGYFTD